MRRNSMNFEKKYVPFDEKDATDDTMCVFIRPIHKKLIKKY